MKSIFPPLIKAQGLNLRRGGQTLISDLSFSLYEQERLALRGPAGIGKSSLLNALMGFVPLQSGQLTILGQPLHTAQDFIPLRGQVGYVFQSPEDQLFCPTVLEDVCFGPLNLGATPADARAQAMAQLDQLQIRDLASRACATLSGGQQRLVALAGVLVMQPKVLLLDEPTTFLDAAAAERVQEVLLACGLPMIFTTHDEACAQALATRSLYLA